MTSRPSIVGIALVAALTLCGCASKGTSGSPSASPGRARVSAAKMCQAHGGTYDTATQQCSYTAGTRSAKQTCEMQGGYYDPAAQFCEMGRD